MSLGQAWRPSDGAELMCYRLIAGIIELLPELEIILQEMTRVGWDVDRGRRYLQEQFNKQSRYQLTQAEAQQLIADLQSLPTSGI